MHNLNPLYVIYLLATLLILIIFMGFIGPACAAEQFNIRAVELDSPDQSVADLSAFADADGQPAGVYRVSVFINDAPQPEAEEIRFTLDKNHALAAQITPAMLKRWGVNTEAFAPLRIVRPDAPVENIAAIIPGFASTLRFTTLQLHVSVPQAAMDSRVRDWVDPAKWDEGVPALFLNYSTSGGISKNDASDDSQNLYTSLQSGLNLGPWRLRNDSTWNVDDNNGSSWQSVNTWLQRNIPQLKSQLAIGDSVTSADIFDSVQFRGVQLASDDNMLPDSLRGFAPVIRGIAQSSAQVIIRQNGYIIYQVYVPPGAFTINDLYPTSGSGDLEITIKEADGSERSFVQPFSAIPLMQREGQLKYAVTAARYRSNTPGGSEPDFVQSTALYGLKNAITLYGGTIYSNNYQSAAFGLGFGFGLLGSLSVDATAAQSVNDRHITRNGQSYRAQYAKNVQATGTSFTLAAYRYSTGGFYTFQEANDARSSDDDGWRQRYNKREKMQLDLNQRLFDNGSIFLSAFQQRYWGMSGYERTLSTGWSGNINSLNLSLTYSYSEFPGSAKAADRQLAFNVQIPLSRLLPNAWASYGITAAKRGDVRQTAGINGTALADNNLSYSLQQSYTSHGTGNAGNINASYKGPYGELSGGYGYDRHMRQINYGLKGGIVAHPYGVTFAQSLGQSLAIVRAPGAKDAKVENNTGVYTDWRGYAVVPFLNPYKNNRIALRTETLEEDVDITNAVQTVIPTTGAVVLADFNTRTGKRVLMRLSYQGQPVPFGAEATLKSGGSGIVGKGGEVYLTGVPEEGEITVNWNGVHQCMAHYRLPARAQNTPVVDVKQECS